MSYSGGPGNVGDLVSIIRPNLRVSNDAVCRHTYATRSTRAVLPTVAADASSQERFYHHTVGIHAATMHTRPSERSLLERQGPSIVASAGQGRMGLWTDFEMEELKRLVGSNTDPKGRVSWVKVEEAWKNLNLTGRSKASLSSKWTDIKNKSVNLDSNQTQGSSQSNLDNTISGSVLDVGKSGSTTNQPPKVRSNVRNVNSTVATEQEKKEKEKEMEKKNFEVDIQLTFKKKLKQARKIGCQMTLRKAPKRVSGSHIKPIICVVNKLMKDELDLKVGQPSWNQLSILAYAGAMTVSEVGNRKGTEIGNRAMEWFKNSYREVDSLRCTIGKATAELNRRSDRAEVAPTIRQLRNIKMLQKKYKTETYADITSLVEKLKNRLSLLQSRIALRKEDDRRVRVRQMPAKMLMRSMETDKENETADVHRIRRFWKGIVGVKKSFNSKSLQLLAWERSLSEVTEDDNLEGHLNPDLWQRVVRKMKPWKAPGPDGLQSFWWKVFGSINAVLYQIILSHLISGKSLPQRWISDGRVVLIYKSGSRSDPSNFRPIACLNTCYKLLTGVVATYLDTYVRERNILPDEQVALRGGIWGCMHAHILDQTLISDAQDQKQKPISVAWIDYAKAFDSLPHSYIKWLLSVVRVPGPLKIFIKGIMDKWRVRYEVRGPRGKTERSSYLQIRSGVLQGDSFSPLLFCLSMAPISHAINSVRGQYETSSGKPKNLQTSLSHLFYMDDLKLYAESSLSLTKQIEVVKSISRDISMKLNMKKCAAAHFIPKRLQKDRVVVETDSTTDRSICFPMLDGDAIYKYLGMEQKLGLKESDAWDRVEGKCRKIVHTLWNSDLTFRQKVNFYNTTVIPAFSYVMSNVIKGSGTYISALSKGDKIDKKFRKILVELKARYKASCKARLYLPTELGGCGLRSVKDSFEESTIYSWAYLSTKAQLRSSLNLFVNMANRGKRCVVSDAKKVLERHNISYELVQKHSTVIVSGTSFVDARTLARHVVQLMRTGNNTSRYESWKALVLAGRVLCPTSSIDLQTSFAWLSEGKLSSIAVRNVLAAQEGCLLTKSHPAHAKTSNDTSCRTCGNPRETIQHIIANCPTWLPNLYVDRHDSVSRNIHFKLCQKFGLTSRHYSQKADPVLENDSIKLYWNHPVQTKTIIRHNKPDIIVFDKIGKTALIIEVAVSWFTGIEKQINIKMNRYCINGNWEDELKLPYPRGDNLLRELQTTGWKATFLPVVIGATGEVLPNLIEDMQVKLGFSREATEKCIERMQRSAVLGTSRIIKNHLAQTSH